MNGPKGEYLFCELPDGTIGGFPSWVADVKSNGFSVGAPMASATALTELRTLFDELHSGSQRGKASLKEVRSDAANDTKEGAVDDADEPAVL
jgi:hypothetical protein